MIESVLVGCLAVCPRRLAYPEVFQGVPDTMVAFYNTNNQLIKLVKALIKYPRKLNLHKEAFQQGEPIQLLKDRFSEGSCELLKGVRLRVGIGS